MNSIIAFFKMLAFLLLCLFVVPLQMIVMLFTKGRSAYILPLFWHKGACAIFGIHVEKSGQIYTDSQVLYMSNHISYLDIPALGSVICTSSFVAKKDVSQWPVFGFLSKLQQTAFISRERGDAKREVNALDVILLKGGNLTLFPEGTSTAGIEVLPFKSSLFSIALRKDLEPLVIQPVTIEVISSNGKAPQTQIERELYAWPRELDMELPAHLWRFAKSSGACLRIHFGDVMMARDFDCRKSLAKACHDAVCNGADAFKHQTKAA